MIDDETVFKLNEEINRLNQRVNLLQDYLADADDEIERLTIINYGLRQKLGDVLHGVEYD